VAYPPNGYSATTNIAMSVQDYSGSNIGWGTATEDGHNCYGIPGYCQDRVYRTHNNAADYLFADGHVKAFHTTTMKMWTASSE